MSTTGFIMLTSSVSERPVFINIDHIITYEDISVIDAVKHPGALAILTVAMGSVPVKEPVTRIDDLILKEIDEARHVRG